MELATKAMSAASRAASSNIVINSFLFASFAALSIRSMNQQRDIDALEAQKDSLVKSNKAVKKTIWDWKQQLYAEASVENAVVPLSNLKAIYGEAPTLQSGKKYYKISWRCYTFAVLYICQVFGCREMLGIIRLEILRKQMVNHLGGRY